MRLAPVPLAYAGDPVEAVQLAGAMSRTTHAAPEPVEPDLDAGAFTGSEDVLVEVLEPTADVVLHAIELDIDGGWLTAESVHHLWPR